MLYGTTIKFMEYFGINELAELPVPKEFSETNTIGENAETISELQETEVEFQAESNTTSPETPESNSSEPDNNELNKTDGEA